METANPNASDNARRVLTYLAGLSSQPENRLISGQMAGHGEDAQWGYNQFVQNLYNETGKWVGLIGFDYIKPWQSEIFPVDCETINPIAIEYWNAGGLVTFTWLERNPWTGGEYHNNRNPDWDPLTHDLRELVEPGPMNDLWMGRLDTVASCLEVLRDAGVVVLWRPFLEATYDAAQGEYGFWWNSPHDPPAYITLWRHMFDYFTGERGLNNLLWVYNAANQDNWRPLDLVYPGDDVIDLVSVDVYADTLIIKGDGYNRLLALGKPTYFAEVGPAHALGQAAGNWDTTEIVNAVRIRYPEMFAFMTWVSWSEHELAIVDNQNAAGLLSDSWVITRDEIDWREGGNMTIKGELEALRAELDALASADLAAMVASLDTTIASLTTLRTDLSALDAIDKSAMIAHVDNALGLLAEFEAAKEASLGIE